MATVHFAPKEKYNIISNVLSAKLDRFLILQKECADATRVKTISGIKNNVLNVPIQNIGTFLT